MIYNLFAGETRSLENPSVSLSDASAWTDLIGGSQNFAEETVTEETALGIPAIAQAVNAIAGTIAHLPLHLYKVSGDTVDKATADPLYRIVHDAPNDVHTSSVYRRWLASRLVLDGRTYSQIVRNKAGRVMAFVPLETSKVRVKQSVLDGKLQRTYVYNDQLKLASSDVLDIVLMPKGDGVSHYRPLDLYRNTIGLMIAAERYSAQMLAKGGVPPLALTMPVGSSPAAAERGSDDILSVLKRRGAAKAPILPIPTGFDLKQIGIDPIKQQLIELRQFQISEASRMFNIAPALLFDLTTGSYSNVEMQNISFGQHTISPLLKLIEQEMNAKLFGARNVSNYVEFSMEGLLRGDFLSQVTGITTAINTALFTPNEGRAKFNMQPLEGGDKLYIQGATVPLKSQVSINNPEPNQDGE